MRLGSEGLNPSKQLLLRFRCILSMPFTAVIKIKDPPVNSFSLVRTSNFSFLFC